MKYLDFKDTREEFVNSIFLQHFHSGVIGRDYDSHPQPFCQWCFYPYTNLLYPERFVERIYEPDVRDLCYIRPFFRIMIETEVYVKAAELALKHSKSFRTSEKHSNES